MYRCAFCRAKSAAGQAELRHQVLRPDGSILREHRVCRRCQRSLAEGTPVRLLGAAPAPRTITFSNLFPVAVAPAIVPAALGEEV